MGVPSAPFSFQKETPRVAWHGNQRASPDLLEEPCGAPRWHGPTLPMASGPSDRPSGDRGRRNPGCFGQLSIFPGAGRRRPFSKRNRLDAGATSRSFAWINADFSKQPCTTLPSISRVSLADHQLERELPSLPVEWGGGLQWHVDDARAEQLKRQLREMAFPSWARRGVARISKS